MGIVTGIGDKTNNINVIKPEIDADLYKYILGKNAIIEGLEIVGNTLTAGMCVLCGYRGKLEQGEPITANTTYIYGKFTLHFDNETPDEFDIEFSNEQPIDEHFTPSEITGAGTYYLLLYTYTNGAYVLNSALDTPSYPANSHEADILTEGGRIESDVIATTQPRNDNSTKVATTGYVYNQIDEELDIGENTINVTYSGTKVGEISLYRKAKVVLATLRITNPYTTMAEMLPFTFTLPTGYIPDEDISFLLTNTINYSSIGTTERSGYVLCALTQGVATPTVTTVSQGSYSQSQKDKLQKFGYKCQ